MIPTPFRISWLNLKRDWGALTLAFVLPRSFFSSSAMVFMRMFDGVNGGGVNGGSGGVAVLAADGAQTGASRRLIAALSRQRSLKVEVLTSAADAIQAETLPSELARRQVRRGKYAGAVINPAGWGESFASIVRKRPTIE